MPEKSPIKTLSWFQNGDIRLVLATEDAPELRIERGSPESIPFLALLYEVMLRNNVTADKEQARSEFQQWRRSLPFVAGALADRERYAQPTEPPFPTQVPTPSPEESKKSPLRGAQSLGPKKTKPMKKFGSGNNPELEAELDRVASIRAKVNERRGDKPVKPSAAPPVDHFEEEASLPDEYYEQMAAEAGLAGAPPSTPPAPPRQSNPGPDRGTFGDENSKTGSDRSAPGKAAPDYRKLSQDPKHWVAGFVPGDGSNSGGSLKLGDCSWLRFKKHEPIAELIEESFEIAQTYAEEFKRIEEVKKAEQKKPVEKQHQIIRWPDGENGHRRFAIVVDKKQVPIEIGEKVGEGLACMLDNKEIDFVTTLHYPDGNPTELSHVKTKHFDSLIPASEAANMAVQNFFPNTYPQVDPETPKPSRTEAIEEQEGIRAAFEEQVDPDDPSLSHPPAEMEIPERENLETISEESPETSNIPEAFSDEVPDSVIEASAEAYLSDAEMEEQNIPEIPSEMQRSAAAVATERKTSVKTETEVKQQPNAPQEVSQTKAEETKIALPKFPKIKVPVVEDGYLANPFKEPKPGMPDI